MSTKKQKKKLVRDRLIYINNEVEPYFGRKLIFDADCSLYI